MEATREAELEKRTRRAYEDARLRIALRSLWLVFPLMFVAYLMDGHTLRAIPIGLTVAALVVFLLWYGRDYGRGVWPGLAAGAVAMAVPLGVKACGFVCMSGSCSTICVSACILGGALGGATIGWILKHRENSNPRQLLVAALIACALGTLGCAMMGFAGLLGMAGAVLVMSMSVRWVAPSLP